MTLTQHTVLNRYQRVLGLGLLLVSFLIFYRNALQGLVEIWSTNDDFSYGFLVPAISAWLIWEKKERIAGLPMQVNWWGLVFFLGFTLFSLYGILGSSPSAVRPSIPLALFSLVLFCYGSRVAKALVFPIGFLFFMLPLPTLVQTKITVPLKLISTKLGVLMIRLSDIPVYAEGNIIDLGVSRLQVVDACSGLRYVMPLLALGLLVGYLSEAKMWKKILVALITLPISIFSNGFRIGITGIITHFFGTEAAEGFFHDFEGWIIFMFSFFLFSLFCLLIRVRLVPPEKPAVSGENPAPEVRNTKAVAIVILVLALASLVTQRTAVMPGYALAPGMSGFPLKFREWTGTRLSIDEEMIRASGAEEAFSGNYVDGRHLPVSLYIGYRGRPFGESLNFFHSPDVCLPSSGWQTISGESHDISGIDKFRRIRVRKMVMEKLGQKSLVYFWFQTKDKISDNVNMNRYHLALHALSRDNTSDLFIRPIAAIGKNETVEAAEKRLDDFVRDFMPELNRFLKENEFETGRPEKTIGRHSRPE